MKYNFLSNIQMESLKDDKWKINPNGTGKYLTLYREDFTRRAWEEVCQQLNISTQTESVDMLYFGIQVNN
jgi:hypothetical protein